MNTTEWTIPPPVNGPQVGQVMAGRYRLALFKGGDDIAEVWHAVEESTQQVVTVEILRDRRDEARRTRFLEQAQRMSQIERPSVMKVVAIHDDASETFVVFEHLIPLSIELPDLERLAPAAVVPPAEVVATAPSETTADAPSETAATAPSETTATVPAPSKELPDLERLAPVAVVPPAEVVATVPSETTADASSEMTATVPAPSATVDVPPLRAVDGPDAMIVDLDEPSDTTVVMTSRPRPDAMQDVTRAIRLAKADLSVIAAWAGPFVAGARRFVRDLHLDALVTAARARVPRRVDIAAARAGVTRMAERARPVIVHARPLIVRARHNQIVMAVFAAALVLAVFIVSPLDDAIASALRPKPSSAPTIRPGTPLARAPFVLPPLSAYGASFESQAPYPTTSPNGTVEWVVALRNTGSVGWYRGIEGAQAALALPDGTGVAVQSTEFVAPGQVGWFVVHFRARAEVGTYTMPLRPRIDGRGPLPDLGIHVVVTVAKNP